MNFFCVHKIEAITIIIKGFNNSIGWNLGKKNKSSQRFPALTSVPIIGTNANKIKDIKNNKIEILKRFFWLNDEKKTKRILSNKFDFIFHLATYGQPQKWKQNELSTINLNTILLKIFPYK